MLALMEPTQSAVRVKSAKAALRAAVLAGPDSPHPASADAVAASLLGLPEVAAARCVAAYASIGREIGTRPLLDALVERGVRVLLPVLRPDRGLDWGRYTSWDALTTGLQGTRQPAEVTDELGSADVVIVPAVAVDERGRRLGRGGGSYDRALAARRVDVPAVAVVPDGGVVAEVPAEEHDEDVDVVVTPTRILRCDVRRASPRV
jgi:5-formyltetrahydrofolate cyclo-ligase